MDVEIIFRLIFLLVLFLTFIISGTYRRKAREEGGVIERREEGGVVLILRMAFALPLLAALLLYVIYPHGLEWSRMSMPLWLRAFGAVIAVLCVPLILWVFRSIGVNISETVLTKDEHSPGGAFVTNTSLVQVEKA